jgi:hypothetical protein
MSLRYDCIYTLGALKIERPHLSVNVAILAKEFGPRNGLHHGWGPSASEGPQKQDLTVFLEYNV